MLVLWVRGGRLPTYANNYTNLNIHAYLSSPKKSYHGIANIYILFAVLKKYELKYLANFNFFLVIVPKQR